MKHKYIQPRLGSQAETGTDFVTEATYHPKSADAWKELEKIQSRQRVPWWYHPGARDQNESVAELMWLEVALPLEPTPKVDDQKVASGLLSGQHLIVSFEFSDSKLLVLRRACDVSYFGWPLISKGFDGYPDSTFYEFAPCDREMYMVNMLDYNTLQVEEFEWHSPMHQLASFPDSRLTKVEHQRPRPVKVLGPLLAPVLAARRAFLS